MQKYSIFSLIKNAFSNHQNWDVAWRDPEPKKEYDVIIVGGGGHGLATAYYLAKEHKITNIAILEKGWIGGGNVGRNTTILRSNYMWDANGLFYEYGMKLWENLSQELNYNVMYSPRGIINLAHSDAQLNAYSRRGNSMRLNGIDAVMLDRDELKKMIPFADFSPLARFPIFGALMQPRGGTARHDAVAWGYARQADSMGVDIIQHCEVTGFDVQNGKIQGVQTSRGNIKTKKVGLCVAGSEGIKDLANNVVEICKKANKNGFKFLYSSETPLWKKIEAIAKEIYSASEVIADTKVRKQLKKMEEDGFGKFPICIAKTQFSFSTDPNLKGAPSGHILSIREVRLSTGAEFVVVVCGAIMTMPGLPRVPSADSIKLNEKGEVEGLF